MNTSDLCLSQTHHPVEQIVRDALAILRAFGLEVDSDTPFEGGTMPMVNARDLEGVLQFSSEEELLVLWR
jgi:hypothetical protein